MHNRQKVQTAAKGKAIKKIIKKKWVEEGHLTPETDHPAETHPAPGQVALRSYTESLIRKQQGQRENCSKIKPPAETAALEAANTTTLFP